MSRRLFSLPVRAKEVFSLLCIYKFNDHAQIGGNFARRRPAWERTSRAGRGQGSMAAQPRVARRAPGPTGKDSHADYDFRLSTEPGSPR